MTFTAVFEPAEEGGYIAFVEELPGANSQGETLEEARENLLEAGALIREAAERETARRQHPARILHPLGRRRGFSAPIQFPAARRRGRRCVPGSR